MENVAKYFLLTYLPKEDLLFVCLRIECYCSLAFQSKNDILNCPRQVVQPNVYTNINFILNPLHKQKQNLVSTKPGAIDKKLGRTDLNERIKTIKYDQAALISQTILKANKIAPLITKDPQIFRVKET